MLISIEEIIKPESQLELSISQDKDFISGCYWGVPRDGHYEGKVIYHIRDVLRNVEKYSSQENRCDLRLITLIHDTFKYKVNMSKPRSGENHHAVIARRFAEKFISNENILDVIELHDEAYASWKMIDWKANILGAQDRAKKLIERLDGNLDLYLTFYKCDNRIPSKSRINYDWFSNLSENVLASKNNELKLKL